MIKSFLIHHLSSRQVKTLCTYVVAIAGLIYRVGIKVINNRAVELSFKEDKRMTAQFRRHHGIEGSSTVVFGRKRK